VFGHFKRPRSIHYADQCKRVIIHEFGHALLYSLGDKWHHCWQHWALRTEKRFKGCPTKYLKPPGAHLCR
jgi:hypothetical protein